MAEPLARLIRIDAQDAAGTPVTVRLASLDDARVCHIDGAMWEPAIVSLPQLRYDFFGGEFQNAITAPEIGFAVAVPGVQFAGSFPALRWSAARVRIWSGTAGAAFADYVLQFDGRILAEPTIDELVASFSARVEDTWLDQPLLAIYTGTGGLEGPADLTGTAKPLVLGACQFVPGVLIDAVDNVYQVSAYGTVSGVTAAFDRLVSLGPSAGDHANLAALLAASIPNGRWATCHAQGLVRLGAPADGQPSFHVSGDAAGTGGFVRRAGAMIGRLAQLAGGTVAAGNLTALDTARPWNLSVVLTAQTTARQVIQDLADSVAAVAGISWTGTMFVQPIGLGTPTVTLDAAGGAEPVVASVSQQAVAAPFWRLATSAALTFVVHSPSDIASEFTLRGIYSAARTYRLDDLVSADDGRSFVYINATPGAGNAPPVAPATSNAHWSLVGSATAGAPSGTTVGGLSADVVASTITPAGLIAPDAVVESSINVPNLGAITQNIGTLRTATTGARVEVMDNVIKVFDASNVLRVRIGNLSL